MGSESWIRESSASAIRASWFSVRSDHFSKNVATVMRCTTKKSFRRPLGKNVGEKRAQKVFHIFKLVEVSFSPKLRMKRNRLGQIISRTGGLQVVRRCLLAYQCGYSLKNDPIVVNYFFFFSLFLYIFLTISIYSLLYLTNKTFRNLESVKL